MTREVTIAGRVIGVDQSPYIIAELSGNHNGEIERAIRLIDVAKEAGADAVKLQTYTADTITIDHDGPGFVIEGGLWHGRKLHELYREAHTPWEWHQALFDHARKIDIACFSSPFDPSAVDLLERMKAPAYKIASFEIVDTPLIRYVAKTGKPLVISTGMADRNEISDAVVAARSTGSGEVVLLHCVSGYPTPAEEANLSRIPALSRAFEVPVGLSDHTLGIEVAIASIGVGATVIEKHITLAREDGGPDAAFSLEPRELAALVKGVRIAHTALGRPDYGQASSEKGNMAFRRSLYVVEDITSGEAFTSANIRSIRPGFGLPPSELPNILGLRASCPIKRGTPLSWDLISGRSTVDSSI